MPAISSGIFGFPVHRCASILQETSAQWATSQDTGSVKFINFCNFDNPTCVVFVQEFLRLYPKPEEDAEMKASSTGTAKEPEENKNND